MSQRLIRLALFVSVLFASLAWIVLRPEGAERELTATAAVTQCQPERADAARDGAGNAGSRPFVVDWRGLVPARLPTFELR